MTESIFSVNVYTSVLNVFFCSSSFLMSSCHLRANLLTLTIIRSHLISADHIRRSLSSLFNVQQSAPRRNTGFTKTSCTLIFVFNEIFYTQPAYNVTHEMMK